MTRRTAVTLLDLRVDRERVTDPAPPPDGFADWEALQLCWSRLGPAERRVLLALAERLVMGASQYGPLEKRGRSWTREQQEELLDACIYGACALEGVE